MRRGAASRPGAATAGPGRGRRGGASGAYLGADLGFVVAAAALALAMPAGCSAPGPVAALPRPPTPLEPAPVPTPAAPVPAAQRPGTVPPPDRCESNRPGPRALRRLTAGQYQQTLRDLFGDPGVPEAAIFDDPRVLGFAADARALAVEGLTSQHLMSHAEAVARWAVSNHLPDLSPCTDPDPACRRRFIAGFGRRAYRAPLSASQQEQYEAIFQAEGSFVGGVEAVVSAMLQSPGFLYRSELGIALPARPDFYILTPHEVAAALSYLLTGGPPDAALAAAADDGRLGSPTELDAQIDRLLRGPRAREALMGFFTGWLGLDRLRTTVKDDTVFALTDSLRASMLAETAAFVGDTVFARNGTLADLLTAPRSFLDPALAAHYGLGAGTGAGAGAGAAPGPGPGAGSGAGPGPVVYAPGDRDGGLLAHASVLTGFATPATSSPVQRGNLIRSRFFCQALPPPPADVDTSLPPPAPFTTTRARYQEHARNPACASCHALMDPIGFAFERYDGFGRRRDRENDAPIDDRGVLAAMAEGDVPVHGLGELARYLGGSDEVLDCLIRYWSYWAFGRASFREDGCTYDAIRAEASGSGLTLIGLWRAIAQSPHLRYRVGEP